jgi:hypothetical protein
MTRLHARFAAAFFGASLIASAAALAQSPPQAPPMTSVLAGKKFTPPIKGQADVEFVRPTSKREGKEVVTRILVRNISSGPIPRLTIAETWYSKDGQMVAGNKGFINGLLQPGEIKTIEIRTPVDSRMAQNNWNFSHANGTVKTHQVSKLEDPNAKKKEPAAKAASATKGTKGTKKK